MPTNISLGKREVKLLIGRHKSRRRNNIQNNFKWLGYEPHSSVMDEFSFDWHTEPLHSATFVENSCQLNNHPVRKQ